MQIQISLQPKQREAIKLSDNYSVFFYGGAKGGGKSHLIRAREILRRLKYPHSKGLIIRKTYPELLSNHIRKFFTEYPETKKWYNKSEKAIYWPNGSITEFSYLKNTDDVYIYQGRDYDDISIDEITQHEEEVFQILRSSNRRSNPTLKSTLEPRMFLTGNPGGKGHAWVKRLFIERNYNPNETASEYGFLQAFLEDNKALTVSDPEYEKRLDSLPEHIRKAYKDGSWDVFDGQYFPEFNRNIHVCKPFNPKASIPKYGGIDWGYAAPFVFEGAALQKVKYQGVMFHRLWIYKEITGVKKTAQEWADILKEKVPLEQYEAVHADPSTFNTGTDGGLAISHSFSRTWGNNGYKYKKAQNDRLAGWDQIRKWLSIAPDGLPYMIISENCRELINSFPQVIYDETDLEDLDTTGPDHWVDALRYLLINLKWIDAQAGGVRYNKTESKYPKYHEFIDMNEFINISPVKQSKRNL